MARPLPETFGRYRILRPLGEGGMGAVYQARDTQLDRLVALKVPHIGGDQKPAPGDLERFLREARAAAALLHPNLCPIFDVGEVDGTPYMTMAYLEGRLLSSVIDRGKPTSQRQAALIVRKLATALQEAHARGVIHRDLKPANVMINPRGEPIVMDFGLARRDESVEARLTKDGTVLGTPAYMPPEQVRGETRAIGPACDIYALGVIFYELLAGRLPFEGSVMTVLGKILSESPQPPSQFRPDLDPKLESICLKAMAKKAEGRYTSMAELAAALAVQLRAMRDTTRPAPGAGSAIEPAPGPDAEGDPHASAAARTLFAPGQVEPSPVPAQSAEQRASWRNPDRASPSTAPHRSRRRFSLAAAAAVALVVIGYAAIEGTGRGLINRNRNGSGARVDEAASPRSEPERVPVISTTAAGADLERKKPGSRASDEAGQAQPAPPTPPRIVKKASDSPEKKPPVLVSDASVGHDVPRKAEARKAPPTAEVSKPQPPLVRTEPAREKTPAPATSQAARTVIASTAREPNTGKSRPVAHPEILTSRVGGIALKRIPPGAFWMGSPDGEGFPNEHPRRHVRISRAFYLGIHEVTQAQYRAVMAENPSHFSGTGGGRDRVANGSTDRHPVDSISWLDAVLFCNILSERDDLEPYYEINGETVRVPHRLGTGYRLPSEAEWEYACRAGSTSRYAFGEAESELAEYAWLKRIAGNHTHPVGRKRPNAWGLHDLHGNVWEWCWDWYDEEAYQGAFDHDPTGPLKGTRRVLRGGSFEDIWVVLRSATRGQAAPARREQVNGLRIARTHD